MALPVTGTAQAKRWSHPQPISTPNPGSHVALLLQQGDQIPQMPGEKLTSLADTVTQYHLRTVSNEVKGMPFLNSTGEAI